TFAALLDRNTSNNFTEGTGGSPPDDVLDAWNAIISTRTAFLNTATPIRDTDRPFYDLTVGHVDPSDSSQLGGLGLENRIIRVKTRSAPAGPRLFEPNPDPMNLNNLARTHPYLKNEMLIKMGANITNKSNVFAVWLTVGFFEVVDDPATGRVNLL